MLGRPTLNLGSSVSRWPGLRTWLGQDQHGLRHALSANSRQTADC